MLKDKYWPVEEGRCVRIGPRLIPATNIQVDGYPQWIETSSEGNPNARPVHFGIYFEIMFETGALWDVHYGGEFNPPGFVIVDMFHDWAKNPVPIANAGAGVKTWSRFLQFYDDYLETEADVSGFGLGIKADVFCGLPPC